MDQLNSMSKGNLSLWYDYSFYYYRKFLYFMACNEEKDNSEYTMETF